MPSCCSKMFQLKSYHEIVSFSSIVHLGKKIKSIYGFLTSHLFQISKVHKYLKWAVTLPLRHYSGILCTAVSLSLLFHSVTLMDT